MNLRRWSWSDRRILRSQVSSRYASLPADVPGRNQMEEWKSERVTSRLPVQTIAN